MKSKLLLLLCVPILLLSGCSGFQKAQAAYNVVAGIVGVAQADMPALQAAGVVSPAEAAAISGYLQLAFNLNEQYQSCIVNAQNTTLKTAGKFVDCLAVFSAGLSDPAELAGLRVMNPKAQMKAQLYVVAIQTGINAAVAALGGQQTQAPVISPMPVHVVELRELARRIGYEGGL